MEIHVVGFYTDTILRRLKNIESVEDLSNTPQNEQHTVCKNLVHKKVQRWLYFIIQFT